MVKIIEVDGIPCVVLDDSEKSLRDEIDKEITNLNRPVDFTMIQTIKEYAHLGDVLKELRKKFRRE